MECPNKSARLKVHAIVGLLGWRHWKFNIRHLAFLRLVVTEHYTNERRIIIVKMHDKYGESCAETVRNFSKKIIFSDEAHFQLDRYVNTQNCRIWGAENPW